MGSRKHSARAKQKAVFEAHLCSDDAPFDPFARERARSEALDAQHEAALRSKACTSKRRYASKAEAQDMIDVLADHGRRGLSCYRCPYCEGWHLTSHPQDPRTR